MRPIKFLLPLVILFCFSCKQYKNLYKDGKPHGNWIYKNSDCDYNRGRYREGKAIGKWITTLNGKIYRRSRRKGNTEKIRFYHPNGKLSSKGIAVMDVELKRVNYRLMEEVHWYFSGEWLYYNVQGKLIRAETYRKGELVGERLVTN